MGKVHFQAQIALVDLTRQHTIGSVQASGRLASYSKPYDAPVPGSSPDGCTGTSQRTSGERQHGSPDDVPPLVPGCALACLMSTAKTIGWAFRPPTR